MQSPGAYSSLDVRSLNTVSVSVRQVTCRDMIGQQILCSNSGDPTSPEYDSSLCSNVLLEVSHLLVKIGGVWSH